MRASVSSRATTVRGVAWMAVAAFASSFACSSSENPPGRVSTTMPSSGTGGTGGAGTTSSNVTGGGAGTSQTSGPSTTGASGSGGTSSGGAAGTGGSSSGGAGGSIGGAGSGGAAGTGIDAGGGGSSDGGIDGGFGPATDWVYNLVSAPGVDLLNAYLGNTMGDDDLVPLSVEFYKHFGDDYDFLYFLAPIEGTGRYIRVRWDGTPGVGLGPKYDDPTYGSPARLQGIIGLGLLSNGMMYGNGPTNHETLHHWSMFLDESFGFDNPHWGPASVYGSHGGFRRDSLMCEATHAPPTGSPPACPRETDGRMKVSTGPFGAGSDTTLFAPIELYLMGLGPSTDVPPMLVMNDWVYERPDDPMNPKRYFFNVTGFHEVTIADIIAKEETRPPATVRAFRGAFVVVTATPATQVQLDTVAQWARVFGNHQPSTYLFSFEKATSGRATMSTRLR